LDDKYIMALQYSYYDNLTKQGNPKGNLADYSHASALYLRNNFRLTPKVPFLYHVVLDVNPLALQQLGTTVSSLLDKREFNLLVSQADLPSYNVDTDTKNQYNRKKIVQTKINYDPVNFTFHDDQAGLTTLLWEAYFRYYYQDPNYARKNTTSTPNTDVPPAYLNGMYTNEILNQRKFGLDRPRYLDVPFFNTITINQLHSQNTKPTFTSFTLVNPLIETIRHDTVNQEGQGTMQTQIRFAYESVLYGRGRTATDNPAGFADPAHYDVSPSPLQTGEAIFEKQNEFNVLDRFFDVFFDQLFKQVGQTDIDTFRKGQDLPTQVNEVRIDAGFDFLSDTIFPQPLSQTSSTLATTSVAGSIPQADQTFIRGLEQNPRRLDAFARRSFGLFSDAGNTSTESTEIYNSLSESTKQQVRGLSLSNAKDLTGSRTNPFAFQEGLRNLGLIR